MIMFGRLLRRNQGSWSVKQLIQTDIARLPVDNVKISGWIQNSLRMKGKIFLRLNDGRSTDVVQVVVDKETTECENTSELSVGAAASVTGRLTASKGRQQALEILATSVDIVGPINYKDFPLSIKSHGNRYASMTPEKLRGHLELRAKIPEFAALLRLRSRLKSILNNYLAEQDFISIDTPLLTTNDCEGGGDTFSVEIPSTPSSDQLSKDDQHKRHFFHRPVSLTVSGQLHLEAVTAGLPRVYTFNPAFRADPSESPYHLAEFLMLEVEMAFVDNLEPLLQIAEEMVKDAAYRLLTCPSTSGDATEMAKLFRGKPLEHLERVANSGPFVRMSAQEARSLLDRHHPNTNKKSQRHFSKEDELRLCALVDDAPVLVTDFPASQAPFYARRCADDDATALAFDLLCPHVGELAGGTVRETQLETLRRRQPPVASGDPLKWYIDLRRWGHPPTGGFGLGFDRLCQYLFGVKNIKDVLPFPRWKEHCDL